MPESSLGRAVGELLALPFVLLRDLFRLLLWLLRLSSRWRAVPLLQKNRMRAVGAIGALVGCMVFAAHGFPVVGPGPAAGVAAVALLYLTVGIFSIIRAERLTFDLMAVYWRCALVIGAAALFVYAKLGGL
jgi:hypothetical protein